MVDYEDSSQLNQWIFSTTNLEECRAEANLNGRQWLTEQEQLKQAGPDAAPSSGDTSRATSPVPSAAASSPALAVSHFACGYNQRQRDKMQSSDEQQQSASTQGPWKNSKGHDFLTPPEEATLVSFYASKVGELIGPRASVSRLRRESKVTATAALLYRRFFLSNSVMLFDPKAVVVAAAFLASKVEDAMADVRYLQEGTERMQAPVPQQEIIVAELSLLQGVNYDLLCFHPYKAVLALTEDLRTFLKSEKGQTLVQGDRPISGQDLKPIYDKAKWILEQIIIHSSDLTLLFSPGPIGLASLIVAQEEILGNNDKNGQQPRIDFHGYVQQRFPEQQQASTSSTSSTVLLQTLPDLCQRLKALLTYAAEQKQNSANTMVQLKQIHKKLKKVRAWGAESKKSKKKKNKNKDDAAKPDQAPSSGGPPTPTRSNKRENGGEQDEAPPSKRVKAEPV